MNKKTIITICLVLIVFASGILAIVLVDNARRLPVRAYPSNRATVSGNGGNAVYVGDYLYYIGNYVDSTGITYKQNEYDTKLTYGAIYSVKLENGGKPKYENDEKPYHPEDVNLLVPKIAGFERSTLYVFDKYLIYSSPNNLKDKFGKLQTTKVDFFRVDLDGRNNKLIYTTETDGLGRENWTVMSANTSSTTYNIFLLVNDGGKIVRVNVNDKDFKKVDVIAEAAQSFAFPIVSSYYDGGERTLMESYGGVMQYIYWTEAREEEENTPTPDGNLMKYCRIFAGSDSAQTIGQTENMNYTINALSNGRLMYTASDPGIVSSAPTNTLFVTSSTSINAVGDTENAANVVLEPGFFQPEEKFYLPTEQTSGVVARIVSVANSKVFCYVQSGGTNRFELTTSVSGDPYITDDFTEMIAMTANDIYYLAGGQVKVIKYDGHINGIVTSFDGREDAVRFSVFNTRWTDMYFYIRTFTEGENTCNGAVIVDFLSGTETNATSKAKEYIMITIDDDYLPENMHSHD